MSGAPRRSPPARTAVVPLRRRRPRSPRAGGLTRFVPSGRSLLVGFALIALAAGTYAVARETSMFAIQRLEIRGADTATAAAVRQALAPLEGTSLLALGAADVERRVDALPSVVSVSYDRAFPHTLRVSIVEERPVAVLRRGPEAFLVSARARVIRTLPPRTLTALPRIWVPSTANVSVGATLAGDQGAAVAALVPLQRLRSPLRVASAQASGGQLTLLLRSGLELRLGDATDLPLKLAIAGQLASTIAPAPAGYLDVSVPERPVAGTANSQVESRG